VGATPTKETERPESGPQVVNISQVNNDIPWRLKVRLFSNSESPVLAPLYEETVPPYHCVSGCTLHLPSGKTNITWSESSTRRSVADT
jgi:hypothetical protein